MDARDVRAVYNRKSKSESGAPIPVDTAYRSASYTGRSEEGGGWTRE